MIRNLLTRRAREDARVDAFLDAIDLSDRYTLNPHWELQRVEDDTTEELPMSLVRLMVPAAAL